MQNREKKSYIFGSFPQKCGVRPLIGVLSDDKNLLERTILLTYATTYMNKDNLQSIINMNTSLRISHRTEYDKLAMAHFDLKDLIIQIQFQHPCLYFVRAE